MMNTLSLFPKKTAHPPLVGKTARTCTSITVLFTQNVICRARKNKKSVFFARTRAVPGAVRRLSLDQGEGKVGLIASFEGLRCETLTFPKGEKVRNWPAAENPRIFAKIYARELACFAC